MRHSSLRLLYFLYFVNLIHFLCACHHPPQTKITVGSKFFTEQVVLAELLAQHIEAKTGITVERKTNLGGSLLVHKALLPCELHPYVEYSGTALTTALNESPNGDSIAVYNRVKQLYSERFHLEVTEPLGFENTFAMVIRGDDSKNLHLQKIWTSFPLPPSGAPESATNFSSAPTASAVGAAVTISTSPNLLKSWISASSTAPWSIIKSTLSPATPPLPSSTLSASSLSRSSATTF